MIRWKELSDPLWKKISDAFLQRLCHLCHPLSKKARVMRKLIFTMCGLMQLSQSTQPYSQDGPLQSFLGIMDYGDVPMTSSSKTLCSGLI